MKSIREMMELVEKPVLQEAKYDMSDPEEVSDMARKTNVYKKLFGKDFVTTDETRENGIGSAKEKKLIKWLKSVSTLPKDDRYVKNWDDFISHFLEDFFYRQDPEM